MRLTLTAALIAAALLAAGCGGDSDNAKSTVPQAAASGDEPAPAPTLLARKDVQKQAAGSATGAVMNHLYWAQWGNWPEVVAAYEPRIRKIAGDTRIIGTYQQQRSSLMTTRFNIRDQFQTSRGQFVAVEFVGPRGETQSQSYLLVKRGGKWRILNDTFFENAYRTYVQGVVQNTVAPNAKKPSKAAVDAANSAAESLRSALVPRQRSSP